MRPLSQGKFIFKEKTFVGSRWQEGRGTGGPAEGGRRCELGRRGSFWKGGKASLSRGGGKGGCGKNREKEGLLRKRRGKEGTSR